MNGDIIQKYIYQNISEIYSHSLNTLLYYIIRYLEREIRLSYSYYCDGAIIALLECRELFMQTKNNARAYLLLLWINKCVIKLLCVRNTEG